MKIPDQLQNVLKNMDKIISEGVYAPNDLLELLQHRNKLESLILDIALFQQKREHKAPLKEI